MRAVAFSILLASVAALAPVAIAQEAPAAGPPASAYASVGESEYGGGGRDPGWDGDSWRHVWTPARMSPVEMGVVALKSSDFALAEEVLVDFLRKKPNDADANFYLGVARMELGKWKDAKTPLEFALRKMPRHPDPKSRLGVTYAKLGDTVGANAQRADLVKMADTCKSCRLSPYITGGITMIDEALAEPAEPGRG